MQRHYCSCLERGRGCGVRISRGWPVADTIVITTHLRGGNQSAQSFAVEMVDRSNAVWFV